MRPFSAHIQMLYVEYIRGGSRPHQYSLILSSCCAERALLPTLPLKNIWIHMCVAVITWNISMKNVLVFRGMLPEYRPYLVHIVAVEAVPGVAVRTGSTLDALGRLYAHVLTEADAGHAPRLHHLGASQTFGKTDRGLIHSF